MPLDIRGDDEGNGKGKASGKGGRFSGLNKYQEPGYTGDSDTGDDSINIRDMAISELPDELKEVAERGLGIVDSLVDAYNLMHETDGKKGTREYAALLKQAISDPTVNLLVISAGITALSHMRDAHNG